MTSPLWSVRLRYCVFSTMLHSKTEIIEVARRCVLLRSCIWINSVLPPSHWANCLRYCVQLQHETTVFVWEINIIQSKIKIHKHVNLSWHKILKNDCARGWRCTWAWKFTVICIFGSERFKRISKVMKKWYEFHGLVMKNIFFKQKSRKVVQKLEVSLNPVERESVLHKLL